MPGPSRRQRNGHHRNAPDGHARGVPRADRGAAGHRAQRADPPGPVVAVCTGSHCLDAHRSNHAEGLDLSELRQAIRRTPGGVLVTCGCLGNCDDAAFVLLGWQGNAYVEYRPLPRMHAAHRLSALAEWLPGPGPARTLLDGAELPPAITETTRRQHFEEH